MQNPDRESSLLDQLRDMQAKARNDTATITALRAQVAAMREALETIRSGNDTSGAWSRWIAAKALPPTPPAAEEKKEE